MASGQVTIEFVLLLVVVLVIVSTISIPLINYTSDILQDSSYGVSLGMLMTGIEKDMEDVAMSGCGSSKVMNVSLSQYQTVSPEIDIGRDFINASYYLRNGTQVRLKSIPYPDYIRVSCNGKGGLCELNITKDCTQARYDTSCKITMGGC